MAQWVECRTANQVVRVRSPANTKAFFYVFSWLLVIRNSPKTVDPNGKNHRLGVVVKRMGACPGFDSGDRVLSVKQDTVVSVASMGESQA